MGAYFGVLVMYVIAVLAFAILFFWIGPGIDKFPLVPVYIVCVPLCHSSCQSF